MLIMAKLDSVFLKSKVRGCLLGALIGDCLGAPFEGESMTAGNKLVLRNYFAKICGPYFEAPIKQYTDDTAMTKCIVKSLLEKKELDSKHVAELFVREYFSNPKRGYGQNVVQVFNKLKNSRFSDLYKPAREQFEGFGSYGNGGAMRISPIALYYYDRYEAMITAAKEVTEITHSNNLGIHGALLQCIAVHQSFMLNPNENLDVIDFVTQLKRKMEPIEKEAYFEEIDVAEYPYQNKLNLISKFLRESPSSDKEIVQTLGNDISALHSVPTAIYCFLKNYSTEKEDDPFRKTIEYAISLGGDTDTIASMAGSLVGAFFGEEQIRENLRNHCEFSEGILELADDLCATL